MVASGKASLASPLAASFPPGRARAGQESDAVDGIQPALVVTARETEDVATVVREACTERVAIIAAGGATGLDFGNRPRAFDVRLNLTGMTAVLDRHPEDLCVTVQAGVALARLQKLLASDRQRIAIDPPLPARATIGGIVAGNSSGILANRFGLPREQVLGMTVVDGRGRILRVGGSVVKNVAGYDLVRLFAGSRGSLAVITEVILRTHPLPPQSRELFFAFPSVRELEQAVRAIAASELPLAGWEFSIEGAGKDLRCAAHVALEGIEAGIEYQENRLTELCCKTASPPAIMQEASALQPRASEGLLLSATVLPDDAVSSAARLLGVVQRFDPLARAVGRPGDGLLRIASTDTDEDQLRRLIRELSSKGNPHIVFERIPPALKQDFDIWGSPPAAQQLMRSLKERFDPHGILAPGRLAGGL